MQRAFWWNIFFIAPQILFAQTQIISPANLADTKAQDQPSASLILRWVDTDGALYQGASVTKMEWVWSKTQDNEKLESPALRLHISSRLPQDWTAQLVSADSITVVQPLSSGETQTLVLDLRSSRGTLQYKFTDKDKKTIEMSFVAQTTVEHPFLVIRPECTKYHLNFVVHKSKARHFFNGLYCEDHLDRFKIYFFRSLDSFWNSKEGFVSAHLDNKQTVYEYEVLKPKEELQHSQRLFRVGTKDELSRETQYSIFYQPLVSQKLFFATVGVGTSYYNYKENRLNLSLNQISITLKASAGIKLTPKTFDAGINFFINPFSLLSSSNSPLPSARFYGLYGRLSYKLPLHTIQKFEPFLKESEFFLLSGWYLRGMASNVYGVANLHGPQFILLYLNAPPDNKAFWINTKLAFLTQRIGLLNISNLEIGIGGGVELSTKAKYPYALVFDLSNTQFENLQNAVSLVGLTVSIQKPF